MAVDMAVKETKIPKRSAAIILAGGRGSRMGREKQYLELAGRPMLEWTAGVFSAAGFGELVLVLGPENLALHGAAWKARGFKTARAGPTRMASLKNGFAALSPAVELVAVHDGARPLVSPRLVAETLRAAAFSGAAVPAVPVKDTVKRVSGNGKFFEATLDRSSLMAVQTPQCYRREVLERALAASGPGADHSDESQILEKLGVKVAVVPSDYRNIKITTPEDVIVAEAFMKEKQKSGAHGPEPAPAEKSGASAAAPAARPRFGFGYDIHRMVEGRALILGGVKIDHPKGLLGHSDGDVVLHAVCDALLGSVAAGEIGIYFPPTDLTIMGLSSSLIAEKVLGILRQKKAKITNVDVTIVAEEPKLKPHYENIRRSVASVLRLDLDSVSVKAKSREGLGEVGHGDAIVCYAVAGVMK